MTVSYLPTVQGFNGRTSQPLGFDGDKFASMLYIQEYSSFCDYKNKFYKIANTVSCMNIFI